jgi:hypothetical protein
MKFYITLLLGRLVNLICYFQLYLAFGYIRFAACDVLFFVGLVVAGYGFVDFETPASAESAVKALQAKGVQAQMAKVGISLLRRLPSVRYVA